MRLESDLRKSFSRDPFYGEGKVAVGKARVYVDQRRTHCVVVVVVKTVNKKRRKTNAVGNNLKQAKN